MAKIKALITLVVAKGKQVAPNAICDVSENEAKRLIELKFAERIAKEDNIQGKDDGKPDENGGGQPVPQTGEDGNV